MEFLMLLHSNKAADEETLFLGQRYVHTYLFISQDTKTFSFYDTAN